MSTYPAANILVQQPLTLQQTVDSMSKETIDQSWQQLFEVLSDSDISLFAGAGLSKGNEMPSWAELTAALSDHGCVDTAWRLQNDGLTFARQISVAKQRFDKLKNGDELWAEEIRKAIYVKFFEQFSAGGLQNDKLRYMLKSGADSSKSIKHFFQTTNPALYEVVRMCAITKRESKGKIEVPRIVSLLTTNLDSLIQVCDRAIHGSPRKLRTIERASKSISLRLKMKTRRKKLLIR